MKLLDVGDEKHGVVPIEANLSNCSVSFLLEVRVGGKKIFGSVVCLRPEEDNQQRRVILNGKQHGDQHWQEDRWKATDAKKGAREDNGHPSTLRRWQKKSNTELLSRPSV